MTLVPLGRLSGTILTTSGITSPRSSDDDGIADAHVLPVKFIHVMQRGIADGDAANKDGLQSGNRGYGTRPPDLKLDVSHDG